MPEPVLPQFLSRIIGRPYQGTHTLYGNWQSDNAVDIALPAGSPVFAAEAGTIGSRIGPLDSSAANLAGNRVNLAGVSGANYYYAHLSSYVVAPGEKVAAGQLLGYSGSANGVAHLHFAIDSLDPVAFLSGQRVAGRGSTSAAGSSPPAAAAVSGAGCLVAAAVQLSAVAAVVLAAGFLLIR